MHGLEVKRPQNVIDSLISITENILADIPEDCLPKLIERIEYVMKQDTHSYCDRALLLDYKAELFLIKNDHKNALKKRLVMGTDNDYAKTVYLYLNNLYIQWQKPEQALAYKNKYLECSKQN